MRVDFTALIISHLLVLKSRKTCANTQKHTDIHAEFLTELSNTGFWVAITKAVKHT